METEEEEKIMPLRKGQIWERRPSLDFPETWKVQIEVISANSVTFSVVEFEGEEPEGTLMSMKKEKFYKLYKPEGKKDEDSEESE